MTAAATANRYRCTDCRRKVPLYEPQCKGCGSWDTFAAISPEAIEKGQAIRVTDPMPGGKVMRSPCGVVWIDRAFGGGIVRGQRVLLGGGEGGGKSTLCRHLAHGWAQHLRTSLFVCGEQPPVEVQAECKRIGCVHANMLLTATTEVSALCALIDKHKPGALIVDSLNSIYDQTRRGDPGSNGQMKACLKRLGDFCKARRMPSVFLAHLNGKDAVAGPRWIRHEVDAVATLTIEKSGRRALRVTKNRNGPDHTLMLTMTEKGLTHG